jgi:catechol 2,3-dioxygenase-like lactoylglutathione lyase family enzyme
MQQRTISYNWTNPAKGDTCRSGLRIDIGQTSISDGGMTMQQRLDIITLGIRDLAASRRFYIDGLGWQPALELPQLIVLQVGQQRLLALFAADDKGSRPPTGQPAGDTGSGVPSIILGHCVETERAVVEVLRRAADAGATILKPPGHSDDFNGYHGIFTDPDGVRWLIAHAPAWRAHSLRA